MNTTGDTGDTTNYVKNGEWVLIDLLVEKKQIKYSWCSHPYTQIVYYILIKRRPHFYIYIMILPCIVLTFIGLLGFLVPPDSGEVNN